MIYYEREFKSSWKFTEQRNEQYNDPFSAFAIKSWRQSRDTYSNAAFLQLESHSQCFSHKYIGIMAREEGSFQFLQLPTIKVRPASPALATTLVRFSVASWKKLCVTIRNYNLKIPTSKITLKLIIWKPFINFNL